MSRRFRTLSTVGLLSLLASLVLVIPAAGDEPAPQLRLLPSVGQVQAVSCPRALVCFAAGWTARPSAQQKPIAFVQRLLNGQPDGPMRTYPQSEEFDALSCPSPSFCEATAPIPTSKGVVSRLVTIRKGTFGKPTRIPGEQGIEALSCSPDRTCQTLGERANKVGGGEHVMTASITNGKPAQAVAIAHLGHPFAEPESLSCPATGTCFAQGYGFFGSKPTIKDFVVPIDSGVPGTPRFRTEPPQGGSLNAMSCVSTTQCFGVGVATTGSGGSIAGYVVPITNGSFGAMTTISGTSELYSISCSSSACQAAGIVYDDPDSPNTQHGVVVPVSTGGTPGSGTAYDASSVLATDACPTGGSSCVAGGTTSETVDQEGAIVSTSEPAQQAVVKMGATPKGSASSQSPVTFTALIPDVSGWPRATGDVIFTRGARLLCDSALHTSSTGAAKAVCKTSGTALHTGGPYKIHAHYSGDADYLAADHTLHYTITP